MKKLLTKNWFIYFFYIMFALVGIWFLTKLWIPNGFAIAGHDSGLAVNALDFFKSRLFAWDAQGFGRDNSGYFGSLIMHFIDFLTAKLSGVLYAGNQLNIFFWISAIFVSAGIFSHSLKDKLGRYFEFLFPVFITFNFYILQSIFIFERAKYSVLVASLLFLTIYVKMREKKISIILAGIISSLVLSIFNCGSWLGVPLYGGLLVIGLSVTLFELIFAFKQKSLRIFLNLLLFYLVTAVGFLILNSYSILPYLVKFTGQDYISVNSEGVISANKAWLDNISQASSMLNIFRLEAVPDWYATATAINPSHPYAGLYLNNQSYVILSFLFPILIFISFLIAKTKEQRTLVALFGITMFLGAFFTAGSHPPLGFIFTIFFERIPGFSVFRSPYYKFGSAFYASALILIAFSFSGLITKLVGFLKSKYAYIVGLILFLLTVSAWLGFYNIFLKPEKIFTWHPQLSTRMQIPSYVFDFTKWFDNQKTGDSRTLLVPPMNNSWRNDAYSWGYWSLTNLPSVISAKPFVSNIEVNQGEQVWIDRLYSLLASGDEKRSFELSEKLGIDYLLLRNDVLSDNSWSAVSNPSLYEQKINKFTNLERIAVFDKWVVYKFRRDNTPIFSITQRLVSINGAYQYLSQNFFNNENTVWGSDAGFLGEFLFKKVNDYSCQSCPLEERDALTSLPEVNILPNSPLYFFKQRNENNALKAASTKRSVIDAYLGIVVRRGAEIRNMWDFGLNTEYAIDSLIKMNGYLKDALAIYKSDGDIDQYFEGKRLMDNLNVVERSFKEIAINYDFGKKKENYRQGILDVLWNINELKKQFPIIEDKDKLETEKVYSIESSRGYGENLYLDENSLPFDISGKPIFPISIIFYSGEKAEKIQIERTNTTLFKMNMPSGYTKGKLVLKFPKFPNLFVNKRIGVELSPTGPRSCIEGSLAKFNPNRKYRIEATASKTLHAIKLFLKDGDINIGDSRYIQGQDEMEIGQTSPLRPFYHIYYPSGGAAYLNIYLCSSDLTEPQVENFEIHEVISPKIISISETPPLINSDPVLRYQKIDTTHYKVNIEGAQKPFVLIFNQAYNSAWQISEPESNHFSINGYANAWKISKTGDYSLNIEYLPQLKFRKGVSISLIGFLVFTGLSTFLFLNKRRK